MTLLWCVCLIAYDTLLISSPCNLYKTDKHRRKTLSPSAILFLWTVVNHGYVGECLFWCFVVLAEGIGQGPKCRMQNVALHTSNLGYMTLHCLLSYTCKCDPFWENPPKRGPYKKIFSLPAGSLMPEEAILEV